MTNLLQQRSPYSTNQGRTSEEIDSHPRRQITQGVLGVSIDYSSVGEYVK